MKIYQVARPGFGKNLSEKKSLVILSQGVGGYDIEDVWVGLGTF